MTPKEKAVQLVQQMYLNGSTDSCEVCRENAANRTALIAVDEIINASPSLPILGDGGTFGEDIMLSSEYWQQVKTEIENL